MPTKTVGGRVLPHSESCLKGDTMTTYEELQIIIAITVLIINILKYVNSRK